MDNITQSMIEAAYTLAKAVYHNKIDRTVAIQQLESIHLNPSSASIYIENFSRMMTGNCLTRTMSKAGFDTFLAGIAADYGQDALRLALQSTFEHVRYYESHGRGGLPGVEAIASGFRRKHFPS